MMENTKVVAFQTQTSNTPKIPQYFHTYAFFQQSQTYREDYTESTLQYKNAIPTVLET